LAFLAYKPFGEPNPSITNLALGVVLLIVITCNSILNVYQQLKSIKIVAAFSKLLPTLATVRRNGREQQVLTDELVPGDIILVRMGDKLPADCRFISCDGLKVIIKFAFFLTKSKIVFVFLIDKYSRINR
jgi:sodium/potassium-transporting ATPase subunit alpha